MSGILFLCTANACRSQMAEGIARHLLPPNIAVFSAGTRPTALDPRAVQVLAEVGIDIADHRAKPIGEIPMDAVDRVITLCGGAAESCPAVLEKQRDHWPLPDPAAAVGSVDEVLAIFRSVRDDILRRVRALADSETAR